MTSYPYAEGAFARFAGAPVSDNPYPEDDEDERHQEWKDGWYSVTNPNEEEE